MTIKTQPEKIIRCTNCNKKQLVLDPKDYLCSNCGYSPHMANDFDYVIYQLTKN